MGHLDIHVSAIEAIRHLFRDQADVVFSFFSNELDSAVLNNPRKVVAELLLLLSLQLLDVLAAT
jgi:hypothetical protein